MADNTVTVSNGLATQADICKLFDITDKTVRNKLRALAPVMKRGNHVYYRLTEVLPLIVKPANVGEYIKTMSFAELPKDLSKEYWAGQRSRQIYLREAGDLWPTKDVVDKVGDAFKTIAMKIRLMPDSISRVSTLSEAQQQEMERIVDETLLGIAKELKSKFAMPVRDPEVAPPSAAQITYEEDDDEL